MRTLSVALLAGMLLFSCAKAKEKIDNMLAGGSEEKTFSVSGIVLETNRSTNSVTMTHDQIPGLINSGGEHTYELRGQQIDSLDFSGHGVFLKGTLHKKGRQFWLTDVTVTSPGR